MALVRMPMGGEINEMEQSYFPRAKFWDRFATTTAAETIYIADLPGGKDFDCPDGSHLDQRDTARFTNLLLDRLVETGLIRE